MALPKGTTLGPYVIDVLLGAGGMGEVYRARDSRLDRTVAIKTLTPGLTAGDERRARFEREARAISALSSPHICALYDIGRAGDVEYLVMEYLEGETLADRLARGPLPLSQAIRYAIEIAEALHQAHRANLTHRDLKPGNVMLTASGVKLLDFGLAKLTAPPVFSEQSAPATMVNPITAEGTIVGTVMYMSPEQLEGKAVDARTDIFALGVVMYEMVTGRRPFNGGSTLSVVASILANDPQPVRSMQPGCPPELERIILTALQKKPDDRWHSAQDLARQLRWLSESSGTQAAAVAKRPFRWWIAAATAIVAGALAYGAARLQPAATRTTMRLNLLPPDDIGIRFVPESPDFAISPDGRTLAFTGIRNGARSIYLRQLDSYEAHEVNGSADGKGPFWSSDGKWLGFSANGKLWKTKVGSDGVPQALCDVYIGGAIASWAGDTILFVDRAGGRHEIYRVSANGGPAVQQTTIKPGEWRHAWPYLLPDGRHFLYHAAESNSISRKLILGSLDSPDTSLLTKNVSQATLIGKDQLAFVRDGKLVAQRFDVTKGALIGEPVLIADNVWYFYPSGCAGFDALNGVVVYRTDTSKGRLALADRSGKVKVVDDQHRFDELSASFSNDGRRAAVTVLDGGGLGDIWIYDLARGGRDRFTNDQALSITPIWTPDGNAIAYALAAAGSLPNVVRRSLATASSVETLTPPGPFQFPHSFTPDGATLFFTRTSPQTKTDILRLDLQTKTATPLLDTPFNEQEPIASPDGKWLAFTSDATGTTEVYLQSLVRNDLPRIRVSTGTGHLPRWRRDGGELFFLSDTNSIMSAVPRAGDWNNATVTEVFRAPGDTRRYDASPDGQSFLLVEDSPGVSDASFHVIVGWQ